MTGRSKCSEMHRGAILYQVLILLAKAQPLADRRALLAPSTALLARNGSPQGVPAMAALKGGPQGEPARGACKGARKGCPRGLRVLAQEVRKKKGEVVASRITLLALSRALLARKGYSQGEPYYMYVYMFVCIFMYVYTYTFIYIHMYMCVYICLSEQGE